MAFATNIAERLRHSIEITPVKISRNPGLLKITISIGTARCEGESDTAEQLLRGADQALYRAKRTGHNKVFADAA
ncbi:MAG: diguanylate cyclase [Alphaproteobacteria bacterium]|nr:diguanylate cyclase [Alphaproteobacteria bacterium]